MIEPRLTYRAICDSCGITIGTFEERTYPGPQFVTQQLLDRHGWTAFEELHHCFRCPPLCPSCGGTDCSGDPHTGDSAYVSREPNVIAELPCPAGGAVLCDYGDEYCVRCDQPKDSERTHGQG